MTIGKLAVLPITILMSCLLAAGEGALQGATEPRSGQNPSSAPGTKGAANEGPIVIQVEVVDSECSALAGADILAAIAYSRGAGESEPIVQQTKTDGQGHARLEVARERPGAMVSFGEVWAYQPGRALAVSGALVLRGSSPAHLVRLTLEQPARWNVTVAGPDNRPIAGLRVAPVTLRKANGRRAWFYIPGEWINRLAVTTDAQGAAALVCVPATMVPLSLQIDGPGITPHTLPLPAEQGNNLVLKLGRPGRLVGIVRTAAGESLAGQPVEVWVQGTGAVPGDPVRRKIAPEAIVRLDSGPLKTGAQGTFQTPPTLLSGSTYRVSIRRDGFVPFVSDWVTLDGDRATVPPIRLQPLQNLAGRVQDRQGHAIAGGGYSCRGVNRRL